MRLARLLSAALSFTVVSALAVPEPRASAQAPADADVEKRQTGGGFTRSCSSYSVYQNSMDGRWYLGGTCRNNAGGQTKSAIALDICLANIAGSLKWQLKCVTASVFPRHFDTAMGARPRD